MSSTIRQNIDGGQTIGQLSWNAHLSGPQLASLGFSHIRLPTIYPWDLLNHKRTLTQLHKYAPSTQAILTLDPFFAPYSVDNPWWRHTLTHGKQSRYSATFDSHFALPILENDGQLRLCFNSQRGFELHHGRHNLPVAMRSYPGLLFHWLGEHSANRYIAPHEYAELKRIVSEIQSALLRRYLSDDSLIAQVINWFSASPVRTASIVTFLKTHDDLVGQVLKEQHYRLRPCEMTERRELAIRHDDKKVLAAYHEPLVRLVKQHRIITHLHIKRSSMLTQIQSIYRPDLRIEDYAIEKTRVNAIEIALRKKTPDIRHLEDLNAGDLDLLKHILHLRRSHPDLFEKGHRANVDIVGTLAPHLEAYIRIRKERQILIVIPRQHSVRTQQRDTQIILPDASPRQWFNLVDQTIVLVRHGKIRSSTIFAKHSPPDNPPNLHETINHVPRPAVLLNFLWRY